MIYTVTIHSVKSHPNTLQSRGWGRQNRYDAVSVRRRSPDGAPLVATDRGYAIGACPYSISVAYLARVARTRAQTRSLAE